MSSAPVRTLPAIKATAKLALLSAAIGLPLIPPALADAPPERGEVRFKLLDYQESQPGADRVNVKAGTVSVLSPVGENWSLNGSYVVDSISGASPAYHSERLTRLYDLRRAYGVGVSRYLPHATLSAGLNYSTESDYVSRALSLQGSFSSEDNNTTITTGVGFSADRIRVAFRRLDDTKHVTDVLVGVSQVLTRRDIAQLTFSTTRGRGYFTDPYKLVDERPRTRKTSRVLARWNHHFPLTEGTVRLSFRAARDNWAVRSKTFTLEYAQPAGTWVLTPSARLYRQTPARFYLPVDPATAPGPAFPAADATHFSEDQRLSGFGALTFGFKAEVALGNDWSIDAKLERYQQKARWARSGAGDPGLKDFRAAWLQLGVTRRF